MKITLRDWFAGQAIIGLAGDYGKRLQLDSTTAANVAYCFADSMIAQGKPGRLKKSRMELESLELQLEGETE